MNPNEFDSPGPFSVSFQARQRAKDLASVSARRRQRGWGFEPVERSSPRFDGSGLGTVGRKPYTPIDELLDRAEWVEVEGDPFTEYLANIPVLGHFLDALDDFADDANVLLAVQEAMHRAEMPRDALDDIHIVQAMGTQLVRWQEEIQSLAAVPPSSAVVEVTVDPWAREAALTDAQIGYTDDEERVWVDPATKLDRCPLGRLVGVSEVSGDFRWHGFGQVLAEDGDTVTVAIYEQADPDQPIFGGTRRFPRFDVHSPEDVPFVAGEFDDEAYDDIRRAHADRVINGLLGSEAAVVPIGPPTDLLPRDR